MRGSEEASGQWMRPARANSGEGGVLIGRPSLRLWRFPCVPVVIDMLRKSGGTHASILENLGLALSSASTA
jgi:hypothetical protein